MKYLDQLTELYARGNVWKRISLVGAAVIALQTVALIVLSAKLVSSVSRTQYVLAPGIQTLTTVRPGEMPESYVEEAMRYVTELLNGWTYESVHDNYKTLFEQFYAHELTTRTQANLKAHNFFDELETQKLVSLWKVIPDESEFHWCGEVTARKEIKGVACGIVTGERRLYAENAVPVSKEKISYLLYAVNVAPTPKNFFAIQFMRVKRGPISVLKAELEASMKRGVLPPEGDDSYESH